MSITLTATSAVMNERPKKVRLGRDSNPDLCDTGAGACFSKVPKLFGGISGDRILFVSSKLRRLEARNFAVIFILFPLQHTKRPDLQNKQVRVLRMAFRARKVSGLSRNRPQDLK